jgi:Na+-driven multidrug efflux pump
MAIMSVLSLITYWLISPLAVMYNLPADAAAIFRSILVWNCVATPILWPPAFITPASLRASNDVKFTMVIAVVSMWAFRIVAGYIFGLVLGFGVVGVWMGMFVDWFVRSVMFIWRLFNRKNVESRI